MKTQILRRYLIAAFACFGLMALSDQNVQANDWVEPTENGEINWQQSYIEATGQGTARYMGNRIQEELMAKQAARTTALSRLLALSEGVRLTGLTTLGAHAQSDTRAATRVKGVVRGAKTVSENVNWHKDESSRRGEVPLAEVKLRLCIDPSCKISETNLSTINISDSTPKQLVEEKTAPLPKNDTISAIVIDLEQALFLPALSPEIIDEDENMIYSASMVDAQIAQQKGLVNYVKSVDAAKELETSGKDPLVVKVLKITPDNRIMISSENAQKITDHPALKAARVIVALD